MQHLVVVGKILIIQQFSPTLNRHFGEAIYTSVGSKSRPGSQGLTLLDLGMHLSVVANPVVLLIFNLFCVLHGK